jgi:hypothetical protein
MTDRQDDDAVLAIDPGNDLGWAIVSAGRQLISCGLNDPPADFVGRKVVIERPQIYPGRGKGDPNDLITLAIGVGRYTERYSERGKQVEHILPHTWKGSLDPDVCCRRVWNSLSPSEQDLLAVVLEPLARVPFSFDSLTAGRRHNVIDGVGLAKWSLRRARAGVF